MFRSIIISITLTVILCALPQTTLAMQSYGSELSSEFVIYTQPNEGTPVTFEAKLWGDALLWERETQDGYTVVQNCSTGFWTYATLNTNRSSGQGMIRILHLEALD